MRILIVEDERRLAEALGMPEDHIHIPEVGEVIELSPNSMTVAGTVPSGSTLIDGLGVGDVGAVVLRDRKHLAEDGMIVVCVNLSSEDGSIITGPDIITRGFIYVKESGDLMKELQSVARDAAENVSRKRGRDDGELKGSVKSAVSSYLFKTTKRNPMILPVIMEI